MGSIPFALSVHSFVNSVGADAGFAAIIGLAILVLLYFAQARETATLRERLDEAAGRVASVESRLVHLQRTQGQSTQVPVAPAPAIAARRLGAASATASGAQAGTGAPQRPAAGFVGAPAGMAAPALAAATKLIPTHEPVPAVAAVTAPGAADVAGGTSGSSTTEDTILVPATAAGGANGHAQMSTASPPPPVAPPPVISRPQGGPGAVGGGVRDETAGPAGGEGRSAPPPAPAAAPRRTALPPRPIGPRTPSRARRLVPVLIGIGAVAVVAAALLIIIGGSTTKAPVTHQSATVGRNKSRQAAPFNPARVNVAVLNGTAVFDLAKDIGLRLTTVGYHVPSSTVENAAVQTETTTAVGYLPGFKSDAEQVAKSLKLPSADVQPANSQATGVVCPAASASAPCSADVIVTIGADMASDATSS